MHADTVPWWRQAEAHLETARVLLVSGRHYAATWFAQQAAEKAMKAPFVERRAILAPRTHDLEYLGTEMSVPAAIQIDLAVLNPAFDLTRYPSPTGGLAPVDQVTARMAQDHVAAAESVVAWVRLQL